jgi:DNA-binding transcriptional LysR family regulator
MNFSQFDLNLLLVLDTVLTERSVTRAAGRLHVTPPAISNALARLRLTLNDPLVIKSGRGVVPTPRALALAPVLARAIHDLSRAVYGNAVDPLTTIRQFTLAIADAGQLVRVPRLASEFAGQFPRARLRVVGIDTLLSSGGLSATEVDLAVVGVADASSGVHTMPLYEERAVLVARRGHSLAGKRVSKAQLATLRHIDVQVAPGHGFRALASAYARFSIARDVALVVPSFAAAAAVAGATDLVATLPESFANRFAGTFGLGTITSSMPPLTIAIQLQWHERIATDPLMQMFRDLVARVARQAGMRRRLRRGAVS